MRGAAPSAAAAERMSGGALRRGLGQAASALAVYRDRRFAVIFALGVASGLPSSLVFATLSIWLREEGLSRTAIGLFGAVATPYAINFLWAPVLDHARLPVLGALGRRRSWIVAAQALLCLAIAAMALTDPTERPLALAAAALAVAILSATQDVAIDAYRVEILEPETYGAGAAVAVLGWYLGAFVSGAGALYLADAASWQTAYLGAAGLIAALMAVPLLAAEPEARTAAPPAQRVVEWLRHAVVGPFAEFFRRLGCIAALVIAFIVFYKLGEAMLGRMAGVFYVDLAFTKVEIANYAKTVGLAGTLIGVVLGGAICARVRVTTALFAGGIAMASTNLLFALLAWTGKDHGLLAAAVFLDNLTGGLATSAFVAFLSGLCNRDFTATQYALLASIGNFARIQLGALSGWAVDRMDGDWAAFFVLTTLAVLPGLALLLLVVRRHVPPPAGQSGGASSP